MCGFCGMLRVRRDAGPVDAELIRRMNATIVHRGPDDEGEWVRPEVGLGHRRLSIIDLSENGRQPMANEDGSVVIAYNGEVYNFRELRKQFDLDGRGHRFRSATDTEVLLHLYEEVGAVLPELLNGMFALAIWDGRKRELFLARDRFGIKPLFWYGAAEYLYFASEIKAILADSRVPRRVDRQALWDYLSFGYVPGVQTAFAGIGELAPGHCVTLRADAGEVEWEPRRYWKLSFALGGVASAAEAQRESRRLLDESVRRRLIADVPVGVMLSGGMDSSALTALMCAEQREPVHTYAIGFGDRSFDESGDARVVAEHLRTVHREVEIDADMVRAMLPAYLRFIDEPYADGSAIPTYYLAELAREDVKVLLSGEGGDEVYAGYDTYAAAKAAGWGRMVPRWLRNGVVAPLVQRLPVSHKKLSWEFKLKRMLGGMDLPVAEGHLWWRLILGERVKRELLIDGVFGEMEPMPAVRHFLEFDGEADEDLGRLQGIDSAVFLPDDLMIKNDRMTMAHSLEARVPFTDPDLAAYLARVPGEWKMPGLRKKALLRDSFRADLPASIVDKKKVGLEMPYSRWLTGELRDVLERTLSQERVEAVGLMKPEVVGGLVDEHLARKVDHGRPLWALLNFMLWHELYCE